MHRGCTWWLGWMLPLSVAHLRVSSKKWLYRPYSLRKLLLK